MVYHKISGSLRAGKAIKRVVKKEEKDGKTYNGSKFPFRKQFFKQNVIVLINAKWL